MSEIQMVKLEEIAPKFDMGNWETTAIYKCEIIQSEVWTNVPREHWIYEHLKKAKQFAESGLYVEKNHPNEVVRIFGFAPEYSVYVFKTRK